MAYTKRARLILADLSGKNPNVFYELGLAHALAKPAILVAESMDDVPFDLRALRVLKYDKNHPDWGHILRDKVKTAIAEVLKAPAEAVLPAFLETKGGGPKLTLTPQEKEILEMRQQVEVLREEIRNPEHRRHLDEIGPEEARLMISRFVKMKMSDEMILRRVVALGPPASWILEQIKRLKQEKRRKLTK